MLYRLKDHNDHVLALRQYVIDKKSGEKPDDTIIIAIGNRSANQTKRNYK